MHSSKQQKEKLATNISQTDNTEGKENICRFLPVKKIFAVFF